MQVDDAVQLVVASLNSFISPGFPPHKLILKMRCQFILFRKLPPKLCNGTHQCMTRLQKYLTKATIITYRAKNETLLIPPILIVLLDHPVQSKRIQFAEIN